MSCLYKTSCGLCTHELKHFKVCSEQWPAMDTFVQKSETLLCMMKSLTH